MMSVKDPDGTDIIAEIQATLPMSENLVNEVKTFSAEDLSGLKVAVIGEMLENTIHLAQRLQKRCVLCHVSSDLCPACAADGGVLAGIVVRLAALKNFTEVATGPGSRIAAQREAAAEKQPDTEKPA